MTDPFPQNGAPAIPDRVRTAIYIIGLVVAALILVIGGVVPVWLPDIADQVTETTRIVGEGVALVVAGLGVVYRPRPDAFRYTE